MTKNIPSNLFEWAELNTTHAWCRRFKDWVPRKKERRCLKCDRKMKSMVFNEETDRYEGLRTCKSCLQHYGRKYLRGA